MTLIVNYWPLFFRRLYGGEFPSSYCAIDVETTGFSFDRDVITQWGHCLVENNQVVDRLSLIINWTNHSIVQDHWLRSRLTAVKHGMSLSGNTYHITYERMQKEGMAPEKALQFIHDFTSQVKKRGMLFVAHNATFEEKTICANLIGFRIAQGFTYGDNGFFDTDAIEKASQMIDHPRCHPRKNDTLKDYFHRVKHSRFPGVKSNLDDHCAIKYALESKYGIKREEMHEAGVDAYCTHLLMQEYGKLVLPEILTSPVFPNEDYKEMRRTGAPVPLPTTPTTYRRVRGQRNS